MKKEKISEKIYTPKYAYSDHYKEECFKAWYAGGRPNKIPQIAELLPEHDKKKPNPQTLTKWRDELYWDVRADELDARANAIVDDDLVNQRVLMLREQASKGKLLQVLGMEYIMEHDFDTSASAVTAVIKGANLEKTSRGISERLMKLADITDDKLTAEVQKLVDQIDKSGEVIDMEEKEVDSD